VQSKPLITLDDVLLRYCSGDRIVTANERLAKALIAANDRHPRSKGGIAPASSCISTLADYLRGRYLEIEPTQSRTLLNTDAQRLVWLEHTPDVPDIDFVGLYPRIADAWRVMHDWALLPALEQFDDNENHRLFRDWSQLYLRTARSRGWMTEAEIPAAIEFAVRERRLHGETLLLIGFDVIPPSLDRMFDAYRSAGATVLRYETARAIETRVAAVSCNDPDEELRAAVYWARTVQREACEPQSLCIAVPDLVESHDRVVRQLDAILRADDDSPAAATSPYNVSGGVPLSSVPVVADALDLLGWLFEPFHHSRIDSLLHSPFLCWSEMSIDRDEWQPEWCDAARYGAVASVSPLREIVYRASRMGLLDLKGAVTGARHLLALAGWPNAAHLSSESFQAYRSFEAMLDELAASSNFVQPRHFSTTPRQLRLAADCRLFAPERPQASIQVLGYLETIGLEFTGLWVTGLNQLDWPGSPTPTPFIPVRHLKAASVARSDVDAEVAFARRLMRHWRASAGTVVFSHAIVRDDVPCRRSALVDEVAPTVDLHLDAPGLALSHPHFAALPVSALNTFDDVEVGSADLQRLHNRGSGILRDQSACPFRAFARYRLHARQVTPPHSFPDATDRGVATHAALRRLFDRLLDTELASIDVPTLAIAASESAAAAIASLGPLPALFRDSEQNRMTALLLEWLELERLRPPHRIVANEVATELVLHGIEFDLRIDRVDVVPDGSLLVVDYKTAQTNPNVVIGARPEEPQLPMYALSTPGVAAIAFAQVERDECRMIGWSGTTYSIAQSAERVRFNQVGTSDAGWNVQLDEWRASLTGLATEFRSGVSAVRPRDAFACNECNLHALCRIREIRRIEPG